jgi:very-short-patch-repair endonuclease
MSGKIKYADVERDEYLENKGLKIMRFNDIEVLNNIEGVVGKIFENIRDSENPP